MKKTNGKERTAVTLVVNGVTHELNVGDQPYQVSPCHTLAQTLRETLGVTGTKVGCDQGACGSCTVIMDGRPILSCMTLTIQCHGSEITTIEGLADPASGKLHPIQQSFVDHSAFQCGFCTPGIIMASKSLLDRHPSADKQAVKEALSGHYCRCISHYQVVDAVMDVAEKGEGDR
ncbi:2Fe-2S iron-sulfur cluster-binding protein [Desulfobacula sp.]|uniref:(2Fe-2S)-binding protein n=1 Tax=Desulfobacula sp. TaxID=2593537 RepID=UPI002633B787|nr:2Fe-2S iron-sulfur cluster-binding protein [Desulfobacula sp.]